MIQMLEFHSEEAVEEISRHDKSSENSPCCLPSLTVQVKSPESNKWQSLPHLDGRTSSQHNTVLATISMTISFFFFFFWLHWVFRCCMRAFSSCGEQGLLLVEVRGLLIAVASLVAEHGL